MSFSLRSNPLANGSILLAATDRLETRNDLALRTTALTRNDSGTQQRLLDGQGGSRTGTQSDQTTGALANARSAGLPAGESYETARTVFAPDNASLAVSRIITEAQMNTGEDSRIFAQNAAVRLQSILLQIRRAKDQLAEARRAAQAAAEQAAAAASAAAEAAAAAQAAIDAHNRALTAALESVELARTAAEEAVALANGMSDAAAAGSAAAQAAIEAAQAAMREAERIAAEARELALRIQAEAHGVNQEVLERLLELTAEPIVPVTQQQPAAGPAPAPGTLAAQLVHESVFNADEYLERYPDLREAGITTAEQARAHWLAFGIAEGRQGSSTFDPVFYLNANPEVAEELANASNINQAALAHYVTEGMQAGLLGALDQRYAEPSVFNAEFYMLAYPDLAAAGIDTAAEAQQHWLRHGVLEGRMGSPEFSAQAYAMRYPEVTEFAELTGKNVSIAAFEHYMAVGKSAGYSGSVDVQTLLDPRFFDPQAYLDAYPDLREAGLSTDADAKRHFVLHGIFEGRVPYRDGQPVVDIAAERERVAELDATRPRDAVVNVLDIVLERGREARRVDRNITFDAGHDLQLDVYRPNTAAERTPVMLMLHGGAWITGARDDWYMGITGQRLSDAGIAVVAPEYRLADPDHPESAAQFPDPMMDITSALAWVRDHADEYNFDLDHVYIGGVSAGGHLALEYSLNGAAYGHTPDLPQIEKVLAVSPATDLTADFWTDGFAGNDELATRALHAVALGDPDRLAAASPINHIGDGSEVETEFIIMGGTNDSITTYQQQYRPFVDRMLEAGYDVSSHVVGGAEHGDFLFSADDVHYAGGQYWGEMLSALDAPALRPQQSLAEEIGARVDTMREHMDEAKTTLAEAQRHFQVGTRQVQEARASAGEASAALLPGISALNRGNDAVARLVRLIEGLEQKRDDLVAELIMMLPAEQAEQLLQELENPSGDRPRGQQIGSMQLAALMRRLRDGGAGITLEDVRNIVRWVDDQLATLTGGARNVGQFLDRTEQSLQQSITSLTQTLDKIEAPDAEAVLAQAARDFSLRRAATSVARL